MSQILNSAWDMADQTNSYEDEQSIAVSALGFNINNNEVANCRERDVRLQEKYNGFGVYKRSQKSSICNTVQ